MASPLTQSIIADGSGDYTTLASWEAQNLNLVTLDSASYAMITGNWSGSVDTTQVTIGGWTTNETCSITIECVGTGSRHNGVWDDTKYVLDVSAGFNLVCLQIENDYVVIDGLQVQSFQSGNNWAIGINFMYTHDPVGGEVHNCIVREADGSTQTPSYSAGYWNGSVYDVKYFNCISLNYRGTATGRGCGGFVIDPGSVSRFYNCLAVACRTGFINDDSAANGTVINCIAQDCVTGFDTPWSTNSNYNISDDTSAPGANSLTSSKVQFRDSASYDFRIANDDTIAKGTGIDLYNIGTSSFFTDIAAVNRNLLTRRKPVSVDTSTLTSELYNFPLLINIVNDTDIGSVVSSDGNELWFSDTSGNLLPYDIEEFSVVSGSANGIIWVQIPTASVAPSYNLYINCNPNENAAQNPAEVWKDYKYVLRISGSLGGPPHITDMTGNYQWSGSSTPIVQTGSVGLGVNTTTGFIRTTGSSAPELLNNVKDCTVSAWMRSDTLSGNNPYFDAQNGEGFIWTVGTAGYSEADGTHWKTTATSYDPGNRSLNGMFVQNAPIWISHVHDGTNLEFRWFKNDVTWGSQSLLQSLTGTGATGQQSWGCFAHGGNRYNGNINQMRFRHSALSQEWISLEFNTMSGSNVSYGTFETSWDIGAFAYVPYDEQTFQNLILYTNPTVHSGIFIFS
jgi:hypothetical protein